MHELIKLRKHFKCKVAQHDCMQGSGGELG